MSWGEGGQSSQWALAALMLFNRSSANGKTVCIALSCLCVHGEKLCLIFFRFFSKLDREELGHVFQSIASPNEPIVKYCRDL